MNDLVKSIKDNIFDWIMLGIQVVCMVLFLWVNTFGRIFFIEPFMEYKNKKQKSGE